jgi:hypothetical protein
MSSEERGSRNVSLKGESGMPLLHPAQTSSTVALFRNTPRQAITQVTEVRSTKLTISFLQLF